MALPVTVRGNMPSLLILCADHCISFKNSSVSELVLNQAMLLIISIRYLLDFLDEKDISATFFVVGSRVIERPAILLEEYMAGHEISVHTWSHSVRLPLLSIYAAVLTSSNKALTNLTNEQIVAELGWTRKAIKTFLGVTPTTMRPPYGDIGLSLFFLHYVERC